jgi:hypothetical protein
LLVLLGLLHVVLLRLLLVVLLSGRLRRVLLQGLLLLLRQRYPLRRHRGVVALSRNPSQAAEPTQAQRRCAIHDQQAAQAVSARGSSGRTATYIPSPHLSCGSFPKWAGNCSGM